MENSIVDSSNSIASASASGSSSHTMNGNGIHAAAAAAADSSATMSPTSDTQLTAASASSSAAETNSHVNGVGGIDAADLADEEEEEKAEGGDGPGDEEEEEDEGDEDDEEQEEEEPKLKYQRLGASVTGILKTDTAKCLLASDKFLLLGTGSGKLYILDLNGNEILTFHPHTQAINDLSLDINGDHVATCSNDGTVVITNLFTKTITKYAYPRSIKSCALPSNYSTQNMFACGGSEGKFIVHTKGWFSEKDHVIHGGEGPIHAIRWRGELLAWANDSGVKIYDINTSERITHIARVDTTTPSSAASSTSPSTAVSPRSATSQPPPPPPAEMFRCNLCWSAADTLLIGWADSVKIGVVKSRGPARAGGSSSSSSSPFSPITLSQTRYVQIVAMFTTDYMICGISPWGSNHLVLMAFMEDEKVAEERRKEKNGMKSVTTMNESIRKGKSQRPELRIVTLANEEVSADALPINGYTEYNATDYRLDYNPNGSVVMSGNMIIQGSNSLLMNGTSGVSVGVPQSAPVTPFTSLAMTNSSSQTSLAPSPSFVSPAPSPSNASSSATSAPPSTTASVVPATPTPSSAASTANLDYLFYILAPGDIVVAKPRDYDDHITWLLARSKYEEALHYSKTYSNELKIHNTYDIGEKFLTHLFTTQQYTKAAEYCTRLLGTSKSLWETYIYTFIKVNKLNEIAEKIPTANPILSDTIYELVLHSYIENEETHGKLLTLIKSWNHHLYHIKHIVEQVKQKLGTMEQKEKEAQMTQVGRAAEREREAQERRRRVEQEEKEAQENKSVALIGADGKKVIPTPSLSSSTSIFLKELYPPPPSLPPISTLTLLETLAELYLLNKQYPLAFDIFVRLQKKDAIFKLLHSFSHVLLEQKLVDERMIPLLMRISLKSTLELLLLYVERITPQQVMEQLKMAEKSFNPPSNNSNTASSASAPIHATYRVFQYEYLHALFRKDHVAATRYHDEQVALYAEFANARYSAVAPLVVSSTSAAASTLLALGSSSSTMITSPSTTVTSSSSVNNPRKDYLLYFLKNSNGYTLERAFESCEKYSLYIEMVFLLKRMGNTPMALKLLIDELHDVKEAINFVEENGGRNDGSGSGGSNGDNSLWEELITRSLNNPVFLSDLLEHVGSHYVDLSKLIQRIPPHLQIPKLKQKLITILNDCELQQSVIRGCTTILRNDCTSLCERLLRRRKKAIHVKHGTRCIQCEVEILHTSVSAQQDVQSLTSGVHVFFCHHVVHRSCYESQLRSGERGRGELISCPRCNTPGQHHQSSGFLSGHHSTQNSMNGTMRGAGGSSVGVKRLGINQQSSAAKPNIVPAQPQPRSILPSASPSSSASSAVAVGSNPPLKKQGSISLPTSANVLPRGASLSLSSSPASAVAAPAGPMASPTHASTRSVMAAPASSSRVSVSAAAPSSSSSSQQPSSSSAVAPVPVGKDLSGIRVRGSSSSVQPPLASPSNHIKPQAAFNRPSARSVTGGK